MSRPSFVGLFPSNSVQAQLKHLIHTRSVIMTPAEAYFLLLDSWLPASCPLRSYKNPTSWAQEKPYIEVE